MQRPPPRTQQAKPLFPSTTLFRSQLPQELAKGNYKQEIKEDKNRYFGKFLWGLGQLKDSLEDTKHRELELHKEKKLMLLSLSHDIMTPLNTIQLYAKALEDGIYEDLKKNQHAALQITEKTNEIRLYVEEIMKASREDIVQIEVEMKEFYLKDLNNLHCFPLMSCPFLSRR